MSNKTRATGSADAVDGQNTDAPVNNAPVNNAPVNGPPVNGPNDSDVSYRLDDQDRIVEVNSNWDRIARENDGEAVVADRILGTKLYAHVTDEPSRMYVWTMLDSVRKLFRPSVKLYRCDSPDLKRHMEMTILPESGGGLLVKHRLIRIEKMPLRVRFISQAGGHPPLVLRCTMCVKLKIEGVWLAPDATVLAGVSQSDGASRVAYSICEDCRDAARRPPMER
jgi:hypothetical protein